MNNHFTMVITLPLLIPIALVAYQHWQRKIRIKKWFDLLSLGKHCANFDQLYLNVNGFSLSKIARAKEDAWEYTYGEIDFISFIALLSLAKPNTNTVFYDLGSGVGKAAIACAMVYPVKKSYGIELFSNLYDQAIEQQQHLKKLLDYQEHVQRLHFINENFLEADFSDATLIFINSTALFGETWILLNQRLEQLSPKATIITTSKKLLSPAFVVTNTTTVSMSWGVVKAYFHQPKIHYFNKNTLTVA